jgi:hypothetical protein
MQYPVATSIARAIAGPIVGNWWDEPEHLMDGVSPNLFSAPNLGLYMLNGNAVSPQDIFALSSAAGKTYVDASGVLRTAAANEVRVDYSSGVGELLFEGGVRNLLLNSDTLATQSVTTTGTTHTLSFRGTGTVTLSGTSTAGPLVGTGVNDRVSLTFTATAGTLTLTVSGSVTTAQLQTGSIMTSYVPTGGASVLTTADIVPLTTDARNILLASAGAAVWRGICPIRNATIFISKGTARMLGPSSSATVAQTQPIDLTANAGTGDWSVGAGACVTWGASGRRLGMGGGTVVSDANPIASGATIHLGNSTGIPAGQVLRLRQFAAWTLADRATEGAVQAQARAA